MTASLLSHLAALGSTQDEVAATLRAAGIKGLPGKACSCPVAEWVTWAGFTQVEVGKESITGLYVFTAQEKVVLGHAGPVVDFVRAFDGGGYPDLIAGGEW